MPHLKTRYYSSFDEDFAVQKPPRKSKNRAKTDSTDSRTQNKLLYGAARAIGRVYCRLFRGLRIKGAPLPDGGAFIYANHTHHLADVFAPLAVCPKYTLRAVISPQNLEIPVIGKLIPASGAALVLCDTARGLVRLREQINAALDGKNFVLIYPEAHVWDYCTFIREFSEAPFMYPAKTAYPVYVFTSTYRRRRFFKSPATTVFIDGPFFAPEGLNTKSKALRLKDCVLRAMRSHESENTQEYIHYVKK